VVAETVLASVNVWTSVDAFGRGFWTIAFYAADFATGLGFSIGLTLSQAVRGRWAARGPAAVPAAVSPASMGSDS
jgi:hypothetical protein